MGAFLGGLLLGLVAGIAIASWFSQQKRAEAEREKNTALRQQREMLENDRELRLRALAKTLQADCERLLQAQELYWKTQLTALEARSQLEFAPVLPPEPLDGLQQYESLLDLLDDEEELGASEF